MSCVRCHMTVNQGDIHIFRGGEYHRRLTELQTGRKVTTCKVLVPDDEMDQATFEGEEYKESRVAPTNAEVEASAKEIIEALNKIAVSDP